MIAPAIPRRARALAPGLALAGAVAAAASLAAPLLAPVVPIPAMVLALLLGIAAGRIAAAPAAQPGLAFAVKTLLRWAVALLGLRIALGDIAALGVGTALSVVAAMAATLVSGVAFARLACLRAEYGALAGAATAVCGASATLATASVLPAYKGKEADVAFVVVAVNALSTLAMLAYPPIAAALGFDAARTGALLGGSIHDVAQVVGAGYAVSEEVGGTAVVVKLFRVFLLLPVVLAVGWWFARAGAGPGRAARPPPPVFAFAFLGLCVLNSAMAHLPALAPVWEPIRAAAAALSTAGLLVAIGALGLTTSLSAIAALGWRHVAVVGGATLVVLGVLALSLLALA